MLRSGQARIRPAVAGNQGNLIAVATASAQARTDKQKRRLELCGDNLIQLHWGMTRAGMTWPGADKSVFYRTDEQYAQFLKDTEFAWWLYRDPGKRYTGPIWKGEWSG